MTQKTTNKAAWKSLDYILSNPTKPGLWGEIAVTNHPNEKVRWKSLHKKHPSAKAISKEFQSAQKCTQTRLKIHGIVSVTNPRSLGIFQKEMKDLGNAYDKNNIYCLYHGTSLKVIPLVLQHCDQFIPSSGGGSGAGVYFAPDPCISIGYSTSKGSADVFNHMFRVLVYYEPGTDGINPGYEYAIRNPHRTLVTHIIRVVIHTPKTPPPTPIKFLGNKASKFDLDLIKHGYKKKRKKFDFRRIETKTTLCRDGIRCTFLKSRYGSTNRTRERHLEKYIHPCPHKQRCNTVRKKKKSWEDDLHMNRCYHRCYQELKNRRCKDTSRRHRMMFAHRVGRNKWWIELPSQKKKKKMKKKRKDQSLGVEEQPNHPQMMPMPMMNPYNMGGPMMIMMVPASSSQGGSFGGGAVGQPMMMQYYGQNMMMVPQQQQQQQQQNYNNMMMNYYPQQQHQHQSEEDEGEVDEDPSSDYEFEVDGEFISGNLSDYLSNIDELPELGNVEDDGDD